MPHSQFLGVGDGRWTPRDREKALAYRAYVATVCPHCGTREDEWEADEEAYVAMATRCPGCEALAERQAQIPPEEHGVKLSLVTPAVRAAVQVKAQMQARLAAEERRRARTEGADRK